MYLYGKRPGIGRRIGPKTWDRICGIVGDFWAVRDSPETVVGGLCGIYALNSMLVCMRPGIAMEIGFKKLEPM